jgi:hypothetical protein
MSEGVTIGDITKVGGNPDIGIVTGLKLIAIFWAGTIPIVIPAWLIIKSEILEQNRAQDDKIAQRYVTRQEEDERKAEMNRRFDEVQRKLDTITTDQQRVLLSLKVK